MPSEGSTHDPVVFEGARQKKWRSVEDYWREYRRENEERKKEIEHNSEKRKKEWERKEKERKRRLKELKEIFGSKSAGESPLDYMVRIMRDPNVPDTRRDDMAKAAAPFIHSRRIPTNGRRDLATELSALNDEELETLIHLKRKMYAALIKTQPLRKGRRHV
jgi:hypothetical protein